MHQQLWGYKVEWKSVSRGMGEKRLNTTGLEHEHAHSVFESAYNLCPFLPLVTYLLTYFLTPWCRILFEKLIVTQFVKQ
jgi:hypothetical protein